jgi:hypothetical protein
MIPLRGCVAALGLGEQAVLELLEGGQLRWAWDLRRPKARRAYVVVLAQSLRAYQQGGGPPAEWADVLKLVLPPHRPMLRAVEVARTLSVTPHHANNLIRDGLLIVLNPRRGRTTSPLVTSASLARFLQMRRWP